MVVDVLGYVDVIYALLLSLAWHWVQVLGASQFHSLLLLLPRVLFI